MALVCVVEELRQPAAERAMASVLAVALSVGGTFRRLFISRNGHFNAVFGSSCLVLSFV